MRRRAAALALALAGHALPAPAPAAEAVESGDWRFVATLDGKAIGTHRFSVTGPAEARSVTSRADLVVRLLGIPVYRYRHQATERWQGDCLRELESDTDDDGRHRHVAERFDGECLMGFAYWNPRLVQQRRLVDPQTGRVGPVHFEPLPEASVEVGAGAVAARGWRLVAEGQRITLWYAVADGRWIALDAEARGGRQLSYRLQTHEVTP